MLGITEAASAGEPFAQASLRRAATTRRRGGTPAAVRCLPGGCAGPRSCWDGAASGVWPGRQARQYPAERRRGSAPRGLRDRLGPSAGAQAARAAGEHRGHVWLRGPRADRPHESVRRCPQRPVCARCHAVRSLECSRTPTRRGNWQMVPAGTPMNTVVHEERELREIVDLVPHHIAVAAPDGTLILGNRVMLDYYGLTTDDLRDATAEGLARLMHPDDGAPFLATWEHGFASTVHWETETR